MLLQVARVLILLDFYRLRAVALHPWVQVAIPILLQLLLLHPLVVQWVVVVPSLIPLPPNLTLLLLLAAAWTVAVLSPIRLPPNLTLRRTVEPWMAVLQRHRLMIRLLSKREVRTEALINLRRVRKFKGNTKP